MILRMISLNLIASFLYRPDTKLSFMIPYLTVATNQITSYYMSSTIVVKIYNIMQL